MLILYPTRWLRLIPAAQRLFARLKPMAVHTTMPIYAERLREIEVQAGVLLLPGNIPVSPPNGWAAQVLDLNIPPQKYLVTVFGAVHGNWEPVDFLRWLAARQQKLLLVFIGRNGSLALEKIRNIKAALGDKLQITTLGEQPAENISDLPQRADIGISTNPWGANGKSGTVAAMVEHGLPVIVTTPSDLTEPEDPLLGQDGLALRQNFEAFQRQPPELASRHLQLIIDQFELMEERSRCAA